MVSLSTTEDEYGLIQYESEIADLLCGNSLLGTFGILDYDDDSQIGAYDLEQVKLVIWMKMILVLDGT